VAELILATVAAKRSGPDSPAQMLVAEYLERTARLMPTALKPFASEEKFFDYLVEQTKRTRPFLVLADSRGRQVTSEEFAGAFRKALDSGVQRIVCAIGPPNGWSPAARERAELTVSFGKITMPHELAAVVLAEQIYRVSTILAGHPYHCGH